jgi:DNA-directed RNA polymerase specialized sigma24 family protein
MEGSISAWIDHLKAGDDAGAQELWNQYFHRLVGLARKKLLGAPRTVADEEDVALSAFDSFCRGAEHGRFPQLANRNDLWQILLMITERKAWKQRRHTRAQKRGGGAQARQQAGDSDNEGHDLDQVVAPGPTPEFAAQAAEMFQYLLDRLADPQLRSIAVGRMEGHTNEEIAAMLGCSTKTIQRKHLLIRKVWEQEMPE